MAENFLHSIAVWEINLKKPHPRQTHWSFQAWNSSKSHGQQGMTEDEIIREANKQTDTLVSKLQTVVNGLSQLHMWWIKTSPGHLTKMHTEIMEELEKLLWLSNLWMENNKKIMDALELYQLDMNKLWQFRTLSEIKWYLDQKKKSMLSKTHPDKVVSIQKKKLFEQRSKEISNWYEILQDYFDLKWALNNNNNQTLLITDQSIKN